MPAKFDLSENLPELFNSSEMNIKDLEAEINLINLSLDTVSNKQKTKIENLLADIKSNVKFFIYNIIFLRSKT